MIMFFSFMVVVMVIVVIVVMVRLCVVRQNDITSHHCLIASCVGAINNQMVCSWSGIFRNHNVVMVDMSVAKM